MSEKVSIIIAVLNSEKLIQRAIDSANSQGYENKEIIVVDGGSTDATVSVIEKNKGRFNCFISRPDNGVAQAYNTGVSLATGDWIYFLNVDDRFYSESVLHELALELKNTDDKKILVGSVLSDDGKVFDGKFDWKLLLRNQVHHQGMLIKRELLISSPYDESYRFYAHDYKWNLNVWRQRIGVYYSPRVIAVWSRGGISDTPNWRAYKEEFRARSQTLGFIGVIFNAFTVIRYVLKRVKRLIVAKAGVNFP